MRPYLGLLNSQKSPLLIGVSGGTDSMALAYLASRFMDVFAVIVDHGLRTESSEEAKLTAERLSKLGIETSIIRINPDYYPKGTGVQERARGARFEAFHKIARERQTNLIALAHHQGDQDETLYMRWRKKSGNFGLAGIQPLVKDKDLFVLRPLLPISRARLQATLIRNKVNWCEDPSNQNRHYERVRVRQDISKDERQKMRHLSGLARCNIVFERYALFEAWRKHFQWHEDAGWAEISISFWTNVSKKTALTLLRYAIQLISASPHPPAFSAVSRLYMDRFGTLGGVQLKKFFKRETYSQPTFLLVREMRDLPVISLQDLYSQNYETSSLWGGVWAWEGEHFEDPEIEVRPLGNLKERLRERDLPLEVAQSLPSLWKGEEFLGTVEKKGTLKSFPKLSFKWAGNDFLALIRCKELY
ncbi:tRNA lysidine(34) synthetase TilS [Acetobacteraceae bacterium]|nr:tRNA lysidine(34) synthetase TilS [Acetobacteraceae bacterium]